MAGFPWLIEVARAFGAPLDVFLVRKLGAPGQEELAMGAIASGDVVVMNDDVVEALKISPGRSRPKWTANAQSWRGARRSIAAAALRSMSRGKTVILIDDGLATGSTMRAAVAALRRQSAGADRRRRADRCRLDL